MTDKDGSGSAPEPHPEAAEDRRRFQRVEVHLPGRYMLEDGSEFPCVCIDVSVGGVRLRAAQAGPWGSRVVAYIDGIGRLEGYIVRRAPGWFALETRVTPRKGERVEERIAWIRESEAAASPDTRRLSRQFVERQDVTLSTVDGRQETAQLTDISRDGAAVLTEAAMEIGERVRLDNRRARVMRVFPGGLALKFENWTHDSPAVLPAAARARRA
ncbi:MAG: PilZ domain-containing protein [Pseudomonadota bacterium]|nr:PilZ domain-containing protein [Pseudomonadota bacterium]